MCRGRLAFVKRIERIRLYPTPRQERALRFALDVTRELYNALLQERREAYRLRGIAIGAKQQYAELTALRKPIHRLDGRLAAVYRECEDAVLHRLELAFAAFFRRIKRGGTPGYPRFKPRSRWQQIEFPHGDRALKFDTDQRSVTIPGVGSVRLRKGRTMPAFGRAWIVQRNDRWYACFDCERAVQPLPATGRLVGVDRGVHVLAALDHGTLIRNAAVGEKRRSATARLQREVEEAAKLVVVVDPWFSSQECSRCGRVASESRRRRRFACVACGFTCHADVNAALVIRRRAQLALTSELDPAEDAGRRTRRAA